MPVEFAAEPNSRTIMGERATISECGRFRMLEIFGCGIWLHARRIKSDGWSGVNGQPFPSRTSAINACGLVVFSKKKQWKKIIQEDALT